MMRPSLQLQSSGITELETLEDCPDDFDASPRAADKIKELIKMISRAKDNLLVHWVLLLL
jgi:hypothetical protein